MKCYGCWDLACSIEAKASKIDSDFWKCANPFLPGNPQQGQAR